jgi:hypothetical protein
MWDSCMGLRGSTGALPSSKWQERWFAYSSLWFPNGVLLVLQVLSACSCIYCCGHMWRGRLMRTPTLPLI